MTPKKTFEAEQIVLLLAEPVACRGAGTSPQRRDECPNIEIFNSLKEATIVIDPDRTFIAELSITCTADIGARNSPFGSVSGDEVVSIPLVPKYRQVTALLGVERTIPAALERATRNRTGICDLEIAALPLSYSRIFTGFTSGVVMPNVDPDYLEINSITLSDS